MEKLQKELFELQPTIKDICLREKESLPSSLLFSQQKITAGENYKGLPYLVMDYPRVFERQDLMTFRTMIWWGNEASLTLHLQGKYWDKYQNLVIKNLKETASQNLNWCVNSTPWEYHFEPDNYLPISDVSDFSNDKKFCKISRKLPLSSLEKLPTFIEESTTLFLTLLEANNGKRDS